MGGWATHFPSFNWEQIGCFSFQLERESIRFEFAVGCLPPPPPPPPPPPAPSSRPPPPGPLLPEPQLNEIRPIAPREPNNKISTKTKESEPGNIFKNEHLAPPPPPPSSGVLGGGGKEEEEEEEVSGCLLLMMAHPRGSFSLPPFRLMKCPAVVLLCRHVNAPRGHEL